LHRLAGAIVLLLIAAAPARAQTLVDDRQMTVQSSADVAARRQALIDFVWGGGGVPTRLPAHVEENDLAPFPIAGLARLDTLVIQMEGGHVGYAHHLIPSLPSTRLVVVALGHLPTFQDYPSPFGVDTGTQRSIEALLRARFSVLVVYMPRTAIFQTRLSVNDYGRHQTIVDSSVTQGSSIKFFVEPIAVSLNYLRTQAAVGQFPQYQHVDMIGLSGGGWATTLYSAIDSTISTSIQIAGSLPLYLRDPIEGDAEQMLPPLYSQIGYLDLYALAASGPGRLHLQILNRRDNAAFGQFAVRPSPSTYDADLREYEARVVAAVAGSGGQFRLVVDEAATHHEISAWALWNEILPTLSPTVALSSSAPPPLAAGVPVVWSVGTPPVGGPYDVAFWLYEAQSGWKVVQAYGPQSTFVWTPATTGKYALQAWVRRRGTTLSYQGYAASNYFQVNAPPAITIDNISRAPGGMVAPGTPVTWTVQARGSALLEYEFALNDGNGTSLLQSFGAVPHVTWTPTNTGTVSVTVRVRHAGFAETVVSATSAALTVGATALRVAAIVQGHPLPLAVGRPVTWAAVAVPGQPLEYAFWLLNPTTGWSLVRAYGSDPTWSWIPPAAGRYALQVWVRRPGSGATYEAWASTNFFDVTAQPLRVLAVRQNVTVPTTRLPLTWTTTTAGGTGTPEYKYWLYSGSTGTWSVLREWGPSASATWVPSAGDAGVYAMQVWVRTAGSGAAYQAYAAPGYFLLTP
jgi:hypothetical protein